MSTTFTHKYTLIPTNEPNEPNEPNDETNETNDSPEFSLKMPVDSNEPEDISIVADPDKVTNRYIYFFFLISRDVLFVPIF